MMKVSNSLVFLICFSSACYGELEITSPLDGLSDSSVQYSELESNRLIEILGEDYKTFESNFVFADTLKSTSDEGVFIVSNLRDLERESASAAFFTHSGEVFVAWVVPGNDRVEYRSTQPNAPLPNQMFEWAKKFNYLYQNNFTGQWRAVEYSLDAPGILEYSMSLDVVQQAGEINGTYCFIKKTSRTELCIEDERFQVQGFGNDDNANVEFATGKRDKKIKGRFTLSDGILVWVMKSNETESDVGLPKRMHFYRERYP